jgi:hypothetical protein
MKRISFPAQPISIFDLFIHKKKATRKSGFFCLVDYEFLLPTQTFVSSAGFQRSVEIMWHLWVFFITPLVRIWVTCERNFLSPLEEFSLHGHSLH